MTAAFERVQNRLLSCDTLVARSDSRAVFGKNSDRPHSEAQPLESVPHGTHPKGAYVRCQYLSVPQVRETLAVLGSRPWWLWGFEQGVNEAGVAIGNEAIYTRDDEQARGLLGMDLVRLGLERGSTAREALGAIIDLLEKHGQGGDAVNSHGFTARYNNSFLIADRSETYVLETSARHWVHRRVTDSVAIANLVTIEDDWDDASTGIEAYARKQGWWWGPPGRKLNFRIAFEDQAMRYRTEDRFESSCRFLGGGSSTVSLEMVMRHLRDHFEGGTVHIPETPEEPRAMSICCHPGRFAAATAASMVVDLGGESEPPIAWCSMATPCTGVFLPVPVGADLPAPLVVGGEEEDETSLWWAMRGLAEIVEHDPLALTPPVQQEWRTWEKDLLEATLRSPGTAAGELSSRVEELQERRSRLVEQIGRQALANPGVSS